ncbi:MAG: DUF1987 domain-containing protein [Bacteroidales bacterium]
MEELILEAGQYTPKVVFKPAEKLFCIFGNSFPVNPVSFYQPLIDWFEKYFNNIPVIDELIIHFDFEYLNTSSTKQIASLFMLLESYPFRDKIIIKWYYNDEENDMLEVGERFIGYANLNFQFADKNQETPIHISKNLH